MNQVYSLEYAINSAKHMTTSDALWKADQGKGKELLKLLKDPKRNLSVIELYTDYFKRKSTVSREASYFRNYEQ